MTASRFGQRPRPGIDPDWDGLPGARDLGEIPTFRGPTRTGLLYLALGPHAAPGTLDRPGPSPRGWDDLAASGVATILAVTAGERAPDLSAVPSAYRRIRVHRMRVPAGGGLSGADLERSAGAYRILLGGIIAAPGPVLLHVSGEASARELLPLILLHTAGVDPAEIAEELPGASPRAVAETAAALDRVLWRDPQARLLRAALRARLAPRVRALG
ncbi:protein-tyrosine phosphatase family protein [Mycetocola spongiae]|uniref:hypothetical protein n=1 Tax=Mycetocola spongiae TaxID=2859226 RepID=UPI001CF29A73|nr:hypothetical protein [Mycetocola spongiae]UCR89409.1 hypothetical protein KXZ72_01495 [Mycetocola spongiae]